MVPRSVTPARPARQSADGDGRGRLLFRPIPAGRGSSLIVEQILEHVQSGALLPGERLPPERELCQLLGASRSTVREALRVVESRGFLERKVGSRGGAFVTNPSAGLAAQGLVDLLSMNGLTARDVTEARMVLELGVLPLVAQRATEQDFSELRALVVRDLAALEEGRYSVSYSVEFHLRLIAAAHNRAIDMLGDTMRQALGESLAVTQQPGFDRRPGLGEHAEIVESLADGRLDRATEVLSRHLHRTADRAPDDLPC